MNRYSNVLLGLSLLFLIAAPWVEVDTRHLVYGLGVAAAVLAVLFRLTND